MKRTVLFTAMELLRIEQSLRAMARRDAGNTARFETVMGLADRMGLLADMIPGSDIDDTMTLIITSEVRA